MLELKFIGLYQDTRRGAPIPVVDVNTSEFSIVVDGRTLYVEQHMVVVELLSALVNWLRVPLNSRPDFDFESVSTDERSWVWIKRANGGYWVGSMNQEYQEHRVFSESEIRAAVVDFRDRLVSAADSTLSFDLRTRVPGIADPL